MATTLRLIALIIASIQIGETAELDLTIRQDPYQNAQDQQFRQTQQTIDTIRHIGDGYQRQQDRLYNSPPTQRVEHYHHNAPSQGESFKLNYGSQQ